MQVLLQMAGSDKDKNPGNQEGKDCKGVQVGKPAASKSQKRKNNTSAHPYDATLQEYWSQQALKKGPRLSRCASVTCLLT